MTQFALITRIISPTLVEAEVMRGTACGEGCSSCHVCKYTSSIKLEAINEIGAALGDKVEIQTKTSRILGTALLVYALPFVFFFIGYLLGAYLGWEETYKIISSFAAMAVGFLVVVIIGKQKKNKPITYNIISIISGGDELC
ncbi:MAG: SoxR reducing system RseC family protein [Ruminococcaceae bacterium]|nr:SoxR reducing system RseC family protein [Oscillospiraceae bacterium]